MARRAADEGLTTRFGKVPAKVTIERILKNPFYTGTFVWGGRTYQGDHAPIVSADLFQRAQLALRKTNHPVEEAKRSFAYTGLIKCAHCGCSVTAEKHKEKYIYYHCTGSKGDCAKQAIREDGLEGLLGELVERVQIGEADIDWIISALKESHRDEKNYHEEQLSKLQTEVKRLQDRMDAAYEDKLDGTISGDTWRRKSQEWRSRQLEMQVAVERHLQASQVYFEAGGEVLRLAQRAHELWLMQPQTEKRKLLNVLLSNCTFDGSTVVPEYRKPFCWLAEGLERSSWLPLLDNFRNWLASEECRELAAAI